LSIEVLEEVDFYVQVIYWIDPGAFCDLRMPSLNTREKEAKVKGYVVKIVFAARFLDSNGRKQIRKFGGRGRSDAEAVRIISNNIETFCDRKDWQFISSRTCLRVVEHEGES
jgi:hypothetical protein